MFSFTSSRQERFSETKTSVKKINVNIFLIQLSGNGIDDIYALKELSVNGWIDDAW